MAKPELGMFDADNHYYEATDAFTRYVAKDMRKRCMQWAEVGGKTRLLVGGEVNTFIPNPTFDPIAKPARCRRSSKGTTRAAEISKRCSANSRPFVRNIAIATRASR
jgi:hypothetical protein